MLKTHPKALGCFSFPILSRAVELELEFQASSKLHASKFSGSSFSSNIKNVLTLVGSRMVWFNTEN